ncbi:hypothetical protein X975_13373, partial [Stegodyphus mimosarum]
MWDVIAYNLNAHGGCMKTTEKWIRTWIDWKCTFKKKAAVSELEKRLLDLIGNTPVKGMEGVDDPASEEQSPNSVQYTPVETFRSSSFMDEPPQRKLKRRAEAVLKRISAAQSSMEEKIEDLNHNLVNMTVSINELFTSIKNSSNEIKSAVAELTKTVNNS